MRARHCAFNRLLPGARLYPNADREQVDDVLGRAERLVEPVDKIERALVVEFFIEHRLTSWSMVWPLAGAISTALFIVFMITVFCRRAVGPSFYQAGAAQRAILTLQRCKAGT